MAGSIGQNGNSPPLSSDWGGLSPYLIASFFAVKRVVSEDKNTILWERDFDQPEVQAPITDAGFDITLNWTSPFENMSPDQKFSTFSAMLQAGGFATLIEQLEKAFPSSSLVKSIGDTARKFEGKSNITKLSSTQVFTGMPPARIPVTAHFRALKDASREVRAPLDQLMKWALPQKLASDRVSTGNRSLYPSSTPQHIGMRYADMLFMPLVIESMPYPITAPRTSEGVLLQSSVAMQLATLSAIDAPDWDSAHLNVTRK